ncbi:MAG TPA: recombination-associated protein RdgC [Oligoflexus sp.]|uniref:recombination-associated protein RdgC n=1 Tax=Oligoflexus sp. TaxID=1971216 RepID=UPI002D5BF22F|nr:recombination-associated protein RdgC [Oligoflexus sp.]HYX37929.1 recombination-associated protein RdgC [Oligoflexus sp.]
MSLQNGSFSLTRYQVLGRKKRLSVAELNQKLHGFQARPISLQTAAREIEYGWVLPDNPEMEDFPERQTAWDISDCLYEEGVLLRLRIERRAVPGQLLQEIAKQRWSEREPPQDGEEPQRVMKKQVLDEVKEELLTMSLPSISYVDAFWKDQEDRIFLFSQSKMAREAFEDLFGKTFGRPHKIGLFRLMPPLLGISADAWQNPADHDEYLQRIVHTLPVRSGRAIETEAPPF